MSLFIFNFDRFGEVTRFARSLVLFLVLPFFIVATVEYSLLQYPNNFRIKSLGIRKNASRTEVLLLGTSHTQQAYTAGGFDEPAFNFSGSAQSLIQSAQLVMHYLPEMPHLKLVVISLTYFSWGNRFDSSRNYSCNFSYRYFYHIWGDGFYDHLLDLRNISIYWLYGQEHSMSLLLHPHERYESIFIDENGFFSPPVTSDYKVPTYIPSDQKGKASAEYQYGFFKTENIASNLQIISDLLEELQRRRIGVIFVSEPIHLTYRKAEDKTIKRINEGLVHMVSKKWTMPYFDYEADPRFVASDFENSDHLNIIGAEKFTSIVAKEVINPLLSGRRRLKQF